MIEIRPVRDRAEADRVHELAWEFVAWLRGRYPEMQAEIDRYLAAQDFAGQIGDVRRHFSPPQGECLLGLAEGRPAGILMMKDRGGGVCEMNRLYVRDSARGRGLGRALVWRLVERAEEMASRRWCRAPCRGAGALARRGVRARSAPARRRQRVECGAAAPRPARPAAAARLTPPGPASKASAKRICRRYAPCPTRPF